MPLSSVQSPLRAHLLRTAATNLLSLQHISLSTMQRNESVSGRSQINGAVPERFKAFLEITHKPTGSRNRP
jgi:hypothetical protein